MGTLTQKHKAHIIKANRFIQSFEIFPLVMLRRVGSDSGWFEPRNVEEDSSIADLEMEEDSRIADLNKVVKPHNGPSAILV